MSIKEASGLRRSAVIVLIIALMLCLMVPMAGAGSASMHVALYCCFVLAIVLSTFVLAPLLGASVVGAAFVLVGSVAGREVPSARPPNRLVLGSLLN